MPTYDHMLRRQQALAGFGDFALASEDLDEVLTYACQLVRHALETDLAKVMEIDQAKQELFVRAGVGWHAGIVGQKRLPLNIKSSEAYSVAQGEPVVTQNILLEDRFEFADFLKESGVVAIVNVPIFLPGKEKRAYGLLQVDSRQLRDFGQEDVEFLRTYATILGPVIDRLQKVQDLQVALDANRHLLEELQHRVKNHFGIIVGLVHLRRRDAKGEEARGALNAISDRIETLRLVHDHLYLGAQAGHLQLQPYITQLLEGLCRSQGTQAETIKLDLTIEDVRLPPDLAVPLGLILNEFVTNSLKYAFSGDRGGTISVAVEKLPQGRVHLRIADDGPGLSAERPASASSSGTGMRIIQGLARQIRAEPVWSSETGTALSLRFPILLE